MLKNLLKLAWRNFTRNKISSCINVLGLAIGMGVAILNGLWIWDEWSFNKVHQHYDRIARVMTHKVDDGEKSINDGLSYALALELQANYKTNFKCLVLSSWSNHYILSAGEKNISGTGVFMSPAAPDMLTLKMLSGSRAGLKDPHSILLAASLARTLFGNTDPLNQTILLNNNLTMKVTGVYEDLPLNSQFTANKFIMPFDCWVSENEWVTKARNDWNNHFLRIYAEILPGSTFEQTGAVIKDIERQHRKEFTRGFHEEQEFLYPMSQWHLYPVSRGKVDPSPVRMVRLVGTIGIIVLLLACINFMNLSTARSERRAKEVGIRKTIGSARWQLISQFFSESLLVTGMAFVLALISVVCSLSWFNDLSAKNMTIPWGYPGFWLISGAFILLTGILAGSYPAFYLSSFRPVKVLKGVFRAGRFAAMPRKILVVTQFSVSVILAICTVIVYQQIQFAKDRPTGYVQEGLLSMEMKSNDFYGKYELLRQELKNTGAVAEMSESMGDVTNLWSNNNGFTWKGMDPNIKQNIGTLAVTTEQGATVGWQFLKGRDFLANTPTDSSGLVMNETAMKYMGLPNPIGETVGWRFWNTDTTIYYTVLGVIKDMVMESPFEPVKPTFFFIKSLNGGVNTINIKIAQHTSPAAALPKIQEVFRRLIPSAPFDYKFIDEAYGRKFAAEERIGKLAAFFGSLAIFISCLGLFGLASFVAEQRTKEIGIRKVLGATVFHVWQLLSKEFVQLVLLSCLLAIPAAWYFMHSWLQGYTYRAPISWWVFAAAAVGALLITVCTVSAQSIRAALKNPVKSLKME